MADKLVVKKKNHSHLLIDCDPGIAKELSDAFSFFVPGYKFMPAYKNRVWDGRIKLYNGITKELPCGLFPYLKEFAAPRQYIIEVEHDNYYGRPDAVNDLNLDEIYKFIDSLNLSAGGKRINVRDYQLEAFVEAIHKKRALLLSPTGSGKSLIIYLILRWLLEQTNHKLLIIVPTTSLVEQMYNDFDDYSKYDEEWDVKDVCHRIYSGKPKNNIQQRIYISTWQSIYKFPGIWFEQFYGVIGDECHLFKAKSLTSIMDKCRDAEYRYGTTGTLDGTQTHKLVLEGLFGKIFNVTTTKKLQDNDTLAQLKINMLMLKHPEEVCKSLSKADYHTEMDYLVRNEARNKFITNLSLDLDGNTLVLFQFVDKHGKILFDLIKNKAHERRKIFYVSGEVDTADREAIRKIVETQKNAIIVASLGTFSTGINIRNLHNIVFASSSKSQIKVLQSIGRGLRKSDDGKITNLYDIADDLHWRSRKNYTLLHAAERVKMYNKEQFDYKVYEVKL